MTDTATPVDLRAAARAFLVDAGPLALLKSAADRIVEIAAAPTPILASQAELGDVLALDDGDGGFGRASVQAGVAVIPLKGVLTPRPSFLSILFGGSSGGLLGFRSDLREALGHSDVDTIVVDVNSPGGSVSLISETAAELRAARDASDKQIVVVANQMMASAAYEIGAQAHEIAITPSGFAGSIGVYVVHVDRSGLNEALGVNPTYISAGRYKVEGHNDAPLDDEARAESQRVVDEFYAAFVEDVALGRRVTTEAVRAGYGEGRVLPAQRALDAGLVDRIATLETIVSERATAGARRAPGARASGAGRNMHANGINPGPNAELAEEVQARIAAIRELTPPTVKPPGGTTA